MKKAMVDRMKQGYGVSVIPETGADYPVRVSLYKDIVTVALDTTGESLHKRGYRKMTSKAPIEETLAAALIMLTPWNKDRILVDPFCGSGTFPIEAAMMAANMAPGMNRSFLSENWKQIIPPDLPDRSGSVHMSAHNMSAEPSACRHGPFQIHMHARFCSF